MANGGAVTLLASLGTAEDPSLAPRVVLYSGQQELRRGDISRWGG